MSYTTPEDYVSELKEKLEEALMDLAVLKQVAIKDNHYPTAARFRDIEQATLHFLKKMDAIHSGWE